MGKRTRFIMQSTLGIITGAILFVVLVFVYLCIREHRPRAIESVSIRAGEERILESGTPFRILSWNISSAGFSVSNGETAEAGGAAVIEDNLIGILRSISEIDAAVILFQELDIDSRRSWYYNELDFLSANTAYSAAFAYNFLCAFVPFPLPPIGKVGSGLLTLNTFKAIDATRISLPASFKWPLRIAKPKQCLLVERISVGEHDLVLVNLHLEAYESSAAANAEQAAILIDFLKAEYAQGNYCIAGGDFNRTLINNQSTYTLPADWRFVSDDSTPTCRISEAQYSVTDGFILSPNIDLISIKTMDLGFRYSDHNPVEICIKL
ncbi:MAG: endonuclease/exonuclease/phosphatase family protein [Spirochaetaceae bacterium]|nr:endonuclease/exonuclease/phosphatase family protein [Spirochaetaceae bacterium]